MMMALLGVDEGPVTFRSLVRAGRWDELRRLIKEDRDTKNHGSHVHALIYLDAVYYTMDGSAYGNALTAVRLYHEAGYDVTADNNAALRRAIGIDHNGAMVRRLVSYGASPKGISASGAVSNNLPDLLTFLLARGATVSSEQPMPDAKGEHGNAWRTPLQFGAWRGYAECVKVLVRAKVDLNARNSVTRRTALHDAVEGNHPDVIRILLQAGANAEIKDGRGKIPRQMAVELKRNDLVKLLSGRRK
jgi:hypothetical protein